MPQSPAAALNGRLRVRTLLDETWPAHEPEGPRPVSTRGCSKASTFPRTRTFSNRRAEGLSTGQGQRLLIALGIMHNPALLLADEPTSALDAITQAAVLRLFRELNETRGTAMLFISHDLSICGGDRPAGGYPASGPNRRIRSACRDLPESPTPIHPGTDRRHAQTTCELGGTAALFGEGGVSPLHMRGGGHAIYFAVCLRARHAAPFSLMHSLSDARPVLSLVPLWHTNLGRLTRCERNQRHGQRQK